MTTSTPTPNCAVCRATLAQGAPFCGRCGTAVHAGSAPGSQPVPQRAGAPRAGAPVAAASTSAASTSAAPMSAASVASGQGPEHRGPLARFIYHLVAGGVGVVASVVGLFGPRRKPAGDAAAPPAGPARPAAPARAPAPPAPAGVRVPASPESPSTPITVSAPVAHPSTGGIAVPSGFAPPEQTPEQKPALEPVDLDAETRMIAPLEPVDLDSDTRMVVARAPLPAPRLTFDTGEVVLVLGTGVVGRNPSAGTTDAVVHLVTVPDPEKSVSKTHAAFGLDAGGLWFADRNSTNGTSVLATDGSRTELSPGERAHVVPGMVIEFGDRSVRVEAP